MNFNITVKSFLGAFVFMFAVLWTSNANAAIDDWQKAASLVPTHSEDFASESFKASLRNLKAANANTVSLIVPYYTSNCQSSDVRSGSHTPSRSSLQSAMTYARTLGMQVNLKPHLEAFDTWGGICTWRANISPGDRETFFGNYNTMLLSLASLGPDELTIGAELISLSSSRINADNTARWKTLIANLRTSYPGMRLNYSANWGSGDFATETTQVKFWDDLDRIGVSGYYEHWTPTSPASVEEVKQSWANWNNSNIKPLNTQYNKPVVFTEIGYQSANDARQQPWNYDYRWYKGYSATEQVNLYEALFQYWNTQDFFKGVNLWHWETNPQAGGVGNSDYTPQNKPAEDVIRRYFEGGIETDPTPPPPPTSTQFETSASYTPSSPTTLTPVNMVASINNTSTTAASNILVDVEVYNASGSKVHQQFYESQTFTAGQTKTYNTSWTPTTTGTYTIAVGVFNNQWTTNYTWNGSASTFSVTSGTTPPPAVEHELQVWWPTNNATISGTQPFQAIVTDMDSSQYTIEWHVDGDVLNLMPSDNTGGIWHKRSWVDVSGWFWNGSGPYRLNFIAKTTAGTLIGTKEIIVNVAR